MKNLTVFKALSIALLMCPMIGSAMEMPNNGQERKLLSIANQSEQAVDAFISTLQSGQFLEDITVQPYEDNEYIISKNGRAKIYTQLGMFTLAPDNINRPLSLILSLHTIGHDSFTTIIQTMPYHEINNILMIINPDGLISLTQADATYAFKRMDAIQPKVIQVKKPQAEIIEFNQVNYHSSNNASEVLIKFNQVPDWRFMNNFIEFLAKYIPMSSEKYTSTDIIGSKLHIKPICLSRLSLQHILNQANEHFANQ